MAFVLGTVDTAGKSQADYIREEQEEAERMGQFVQNMDIAIHYSDGERGPLTFDIPSDPLDTSEQEVKAALKRVAVDANYIKDSDTVAVRNMRLEMYNRSDEDQNLYEYSATIIVRGVGRTRVLLVQNPYGEVHIFDVRGEVKYM